MILVTGACGYIGSHVVLACLDAGLEVVGIDDLSTGSRAAVGDRIPLIIGDFADPLLVQGAVRDHGVRTIVHLAARTSVVESMHAPDLYLHENAVKTARLVTFAEALGVDQIVFSSTAAVYGRPKGVRVDEKSATRPANPYGLSKLLAERSIRDASKLHHVILRYFNVAGADPAGRAGKRVRKPSDLFGRLCQIATGNAHLLNVYGTDFDTPDGTAVRDYIHVTDLAQAHLDAIDHLRRGGANLTANCGYGRGLSVRQAVDIMQGVTGDAIPLRIFGPRAGDVPAIVAETGLIGATLGWAPRYECPEGIARDGLRFAKRLKVQDANAWMPLAS